MDEAKQKFDHCKQVVQTAGEMAYAYFAAGDMRNESKSDGTVVTEVDKNIETVLLEFVRSQYPGDAIVGEEHGVHAGTSGFVWHIDPIDGTDNFLRKIPFCAVSVARLGDTQEGSFGIVYNPITRQMFSSYGETVGDLYENDRASAPITPDPIGGKYVIAIGRSMREDWMKSATYALNEALGMKYGRCTSFGCTALELAYVSANRFDAYLTYGLNSYDYAAGLFLVKSGGGAISIFDNGAWSRWKRSLKDLCAEKDRIIFASHPDLIDELTSFIGDPMRWSKDA